MTCFVRKVPTKSGATAVQIVYKRGREVIGVKHIGSAHNKTELDILLVRAQEVKCAGQLKLDLFGDREPELYLERSYSELLWDALDREYRRIGLDSIKDEVFKQLVLARIIEPSSKLDTIRVLEGLGLDAPSNSSIHRCLRRINDHSYRDVISGKCFEHAAPSSLTLVLYDVTTLYFETQREDAYRKPGLSKERRLEPQITVGLLVDGSGFPLEVTSFEGNKAEVKTLVPILQAFKARHGLKDITVTADAAMLSSGNLDALEKLEYTYIVGSRISKCPHEIEEYIKLPGSALQDGQVFESRIKVIIAGKRAYRRAIYQYRSRRARIDLANIDKLLVKAQRMVDGKSQVKRNRFLQIIGGRKQINTALVNRTRMRAGIKGYITNLDIPAQRVIDYYHQLFQVEKSFRIAKSDLKARPIFHHKRESIDAHLTIVFAALAISRHIEDATKISIRRFVQKLAPVRTGIISINGAKQILKPWVPQDISILLASLTSKCGY
jgi:transposase